MIGVDANSQKCLNSVLTSIIIKEITGNSPNFSDFLKQVKMWAIKRSIYG